MFSHTNLAIKKFATGIFIVTFITTVLSSCTKDKDLVSIKVDSIFPVQGPVNTEVSINGENFGTDESKIAVSFDGISATIKDLNNTQIVVFVPQLQTGTLEPKVVEVKVIIDGNSFTDLTFEYLKTPSLVSTVAGNGVAADADGDALNEASFNIPIGLVLDGKGNLYISDFNNHKIKKLTPENQIITVAGSGTLGAIDAIGTAASFNRPRNIALDSEGNIIVPDQRNNIIRKVTPDGIVTTIAGNAVAGNSDGVGTSASFDAPMGVAIDKDDNIYVADFNNHRIRKITPDNVVSTFAGAAMGFSDGPRESATFNNPIDLDFDEEGNLYVVDHKNHSIRKISVDGEVTTIIGNGTAGDINGDISSAQLNNPQGIAISNQGTIYIADTNNQKIKKITQGLLMNVAGTGEEGSLDGNPEEATFNAPRGMEIDELGVLYISESNHKIRKIVPEQ